MTGEEIRTANLIKMGFQCEKCKLVYDDTHPENELAKYWSTSTGPIVGTPLDECYTGKDYYTFHFRRTAENYNIFKMKGQWFRVRAPLVNIFLKMGLIEEAMVGHINYPQPIWINRQVDVFNAAEKLGLPSPLNSVQQKRAKSKAFVEKIKG